MTRRDARVKRLVAAIYSKSAGPAYERIVLGTALPVLARGLEQAARMQGRRAVAAAGTRPILDLPVGTGFFTRHIARAHPGLVVGCDIARGMVEAAQQAAVDEGLNNLALVQADAHALPFKDGCFSATVSTNGLQVIPGTAAALAEIGRVTKPGGAVFVAAVAAAASRFAPRRARDHMPGFLRDPREIRELLRRAGIETGPPQRLRLGYLLEGTKITR